MMQSCKSQVFVLEVEKSVSGEILKCLGVSSWQLGVPTLLEKTLNAKLRHKAACLSNEGGEKTQKIH